MKRFPPAALAALLCTIAPPALAAAVPHYDHIFVIIEENHSADEIIGSPSAPNLTRLARDYGYASNYYAIRHPSEPNYVALVGGDTFGIRDDDAFYCKPGDKRTGCGGAGASNYVDHTVDGDNLAAQLSAKGLSWKGYFESLPEPGSPAFRWPSPEEPAAGQPDALYAVKHNGFMTFKSVQDDPRRAEHIVGFDVLEHEIAAGSLPAFAHIVPNQCNDMHGLRGRDVPQDCSEKVSTGLVERADAVAGRLVGELMRSPLWNGAGNNAIVITFDENDDDRSSSRPNGCCGYRPGDPAYPGGGWVSTIVITNHGPRRLDDPTPYNHYSLLRTIEDAFGLGHLRHASDTGKGVVSMTPLFAATR